MTALVDESRMVDIVYFDFTAFNTVSQNIFIDKLMKLCLYRQPESGLKAGGISKLKGLKSSKYNVQLEASH